MLKNVKISARLFLGFSIMIVIMIGMGLYIISNMKNLSELTTQLYRHPFTVSTAILRIDTNILSMHRSMKDVALAKDNAEIEQAAEMVAGYEKLVYEDYKIVAERFLGDKKKVDAGIKLFADWKPIRDEVIALMKAGKRQEAADITKKQGAEHVEQMDHSIHEFIDFAQNKADSFVAEAEKERDNALNITYLLLFATIVIGIILAFTITNSITGTLSKAVKELESAAVEMESTSKEQATASTEQTSAVTEVSSTAQELVATAKQIADNTQNVSDSAKKTVENGQSGIHAVQEAQLGMEKTKEQVQLIAQHMLDLGNKSQRIGLVLEIINELSEQTNLLSLNASIEAAGAGDAGKRFAVVADEVRKLAERAVESTQEIKTLINDIQQTSNTTIMVTEDGTKAVDTGVAMFHQLSEAINTIVQYAESTSSVAREIELTTRQQTTSVQQVSETLDNISIATKQTEQGSNNILETTQRLVDIAKDLQKLISN
ncbi:MAG: methyl-accepting chemotaxis protein [SAR324 cluster bacterium]|nr:methyl-accepting chemotaxis protein [SAR324 cluster bacterium]